MFNPHIYKASGNHKDKPSVDAKNAVVAARGPGDGVSVANDRKGVTHAQWNLLPMPTVVDTLLIALRLFFSTRGSEECPET